MPQIFDTLVLVAGVIGLGCLFYLACKAAVWACKWARRRRAVRDSWFWPE